MAEHFERLKAALADHYALERELGQGGMATVYLARDLKHDRLVAVKVLDPELAASLGAERFLREIQVTAKLSHPHILPLYDSGEAGGFLYYVMPFVEGESLADKIAREKQLSIKDAVQIAREAAEALAQAHSFGLVHRDIKPHNIMMTGGHAIVADFGIAGAVSQAGADKLTKTGTTVGTPAYMSPEQGMGSDQLDGRSDIYSLGCVLFEMLIGQIPFTGATSQQIIARHSMDHIPPPSIMRDTIPADLEDIIHRAMAKLPADRYRTAFEMAEALGAVNTATAVHRVSPTLEMRARRRRWRRILVPVGVTAAAVALAGAAFALLSSQRSGPTAPSLGLDPRRIAVMYFDDESRDSSLGHVADGVTEGLIQELSSVQGLEVVSRNGVAPYRGVTAVPRDSIARALQAGTLIVGSIAPRGELVSVTARLLDDGGTEVEHATFELPARQLLALRDSIARQAAALLRTRLGEEVRVRERRAGTASVDAWLLLQRAERARKEADSHRGDTLASATAYARSDSLLVLAAAADPRWAEPVTMRGQIALERAALGRDRSRQERWLDSAIQRATRALSVAPRDPGALAVRGRARRALYRVAPPADPGARARLLDSAEADLRAATEADGSQAAAFLVLSQLYYDKKDNVSAALAARRAYESDAFLRNQDTNLRQLFWTHYDLEQFPDAERWCREGARRFPRNYNFAECQLWLMIIPGATPDISKAWALVDSAVQRAPESDRAFEAHLARVIVAGALARTGLGDSASQVLEASRAGRDVDPESELPGYEAIVRTMLGDYQQAITLLKAYVLVNPTHEFTVGRDLHWWWRPLRDFPEFQAVAARRQ